MSDYNRREEDKWRLRKEINVGDLLTTIAIAGGLVVWSLQLESRITAEEIRSVSYEAKFTEVDARFGRNEARYLESLTAVRQDLKEIRDILYQDRTGSGARK